MFCFDVVCILEDIRTPVTNPQGVLLTCDPLPVGKWRLLRDNQLVQYNNPTNAEVHASRSATPNRTLVNTCGVPHKVGYCVTRRKTDAAVSSHQQFL